MPYPNFTRIGRVGETNKSCNIKVWPRQASSIDNKTAKRGESVTLNYKTGTYGGKRPDPKQIKECLKRRYHVSSSQLAAANLTTTLQWCEFHSSYENNQATDRLAKNGVCSLLRRAHLQKRGTDWKISRWSIFRN